MVLRDDFPGFVLKYWHMETPKPLPPRNPLTTRKHRSDVFWQITLPLALGVVLILAMMVFAAILASGSADFSRRFADISLVWLIVPNLMSSLFSLVLLAGLAVLVTLLLRKLPPYARLAQDAFARLARRTGQICDQIVEPLLRWKGASASARAAQDGLRREVDKGLWGKATQNSKPGQSR